MKRPVVLVDQDGPLCDFDRKFFAVCQAHGWVLDCEEHEQSHRFATDHISDRAHRAAARAFVNGTRWFVDLPVTDGAVEGINALAEVADVWICTKPLEANWDCRDDKAEWVRRHLGKEWERRLIITPDKSMVRGDVLLDDAPKLEWFGNAEWCPVVFPTSWNGDGSQWGGLPRWTWGDPIDQLLDPIGLSA